MEVGGEEQQSNQNEWERTIETLILNHKQIHKIEQLDPFINLRKLQLVDNSITRIEGLNRCKLLEELSLEKNKI
jgi:Leucine-rich repeat (LRR) protein